MWLKIFAFAALIALVVSQDKCAESFLCDETVCKSTCKPLGCLAPDGKECEGIMLPLYTNPNDFCSCCLDNKKCITFLKEGDECDVESNLLNPKKMCGPRLKCSNKRCRAMTTKCMNEAADIESVGQGMNQSPPECDDEGFYAPVQCKPGGLCRCVDKETGDPIALGFGVAGGLGEAELSEMDCKCARQYQEGLKLGCRMNLHMSDYLEQADYIAAISACEESATAKSAILLSPEDQGDIYFGKGHMRCLPNGNFDRLQCFDRANAGKRCTCIKVETNGLSFNGSFAPIEETEELTCFDKQIHFTDYFRPCQAKVEAMRKTLNKYAKTGQNYLTNDIPPSCNPDGYYSKIQVRQANPDEQFCSDNNGDQIENFGGIRTHLSGLKMNCECALTRENLSLGSVKPTCCANGNFVGRQCISGLCFCVDKFGRQIGMEVDQMEAESLTCQDFCCENGPYIQPDQFCHEQ